VTVLSAARATSGCVDPGAWVLTCSAARSGGGEPAFLGLLPSPKPHVTEHDCSRPVLQRARAARETRVPGVDRHAAVERDLESGAVGGDLQRFQLVAGVDDFKRLGDVDDGGGAAGLIRWRFEVDVGEAVLARSNAPDD
jgi:hypothetical protein